MTNSYEFDVEAAYDTIIFRVNLGAVDLLNRY